MRVDCVNVMCGGMTVSQKFAALHARNTSGV